MIEAKTVDKLGNWIC